MSGWICLVIVVLDPRNRLLWILENLGSQVIGVAMDSPKFHGLQMTSVCFINFLGLMNPNFQMISVCSSIFWGFPHFQPFPTDLEQKCWNQKTCASSCQNHDPTWVCSPAPWPVEKRPEAIVAVLLVILGTNHIKQDIETKISKSINQCCLHISMYTGMYVGMHECKYIYPFFHIHIYIYTYIRECSSTCT